MIYSPSQPNTSLKQGEIISRLPQYIVSADSFNSPSPENIELKIRNHPLAMVVTQDCDLEWDFRERKEANPNLHKLIPSVLFCEVQTAKDLYNAPKMANLWKRIQQNKDERYQFLGEIASQDDSQGLGLQELGMDFKRYFAIPTDELYSRFEQETKRRCFLNPPYSQHLISRFFYFQSRIGLPEDHASEP